MMLPPRSPIIAALFLCAIRPTLAQHATWTPDHLASGSPSFFALELPAEVIAETARWQTHDLVFFRSQHL